MLGQFARLIAAAALLGAQAGTANAQFFNFSFFDVLDMGTQMRLVNPGATTSDAAQQASAAVATTRGFDAFKAEIWGEAQARGVSRTTFEQAFAGVAPDPSVLEKAAHQPEFVTPVWDYLGRAVSDQRIADGQRVLASHRGVFDAIEATYGVSRYVVAAIWGIESSYGAVLGDPKIVKPVIRSLATLAFLDRRRAKFGRTQLLAALEILERGDTTPSRMMGSWAGAMGHTQFIPTTYAAYAVDFDGDGRRDIWDSIPDALASTASYLNRSRWQSGETWGYEIELPAGFDYSLEGQTRTLAAWRSLGISRTFGRTFPRPGDEGRLFLPAGSRGPAFLALHNFGVIKRYNNADSYALAVGYLADRLAGGNAFARTWPHGDRVLARNEREELQRLLGRHGFNPGSVDGQIGPQTSRAVRAFQSSVGLTPDGFATKSLLDRLRNST